MKDVRDHLTEIAPFRCVIAACRCFHRDRLAVALHYTEFQVFDRFFLPVKFQRASFAL